MRHTIQDDFQHFLSYSGYSDQPKEILDMLFKAYEANWIDEMPDV